MASLYAPILWHQWRYLGGQKVLHIARYHYSIRVLGIDAINGTLQQVGRKGARM